MFINEKISWRDFTFQLAQESLKPLSQSCCHRGIRACPGTCTDVSHLNLSDQAGMPRVRKTGGNRSGSAGSRWNRSGSAGSRWNRSGSAGSRWNRSGPVHELVRFPPLNRAYNFYLPVNRPVWPVYRPVFLNCGNRSTHGSVNPGHALSCSCSSQVVPERDRDGDTWRMSTSAQHGLAPH
jgi:hypothetical protein